MPIIENDEVITLVEIEVPGVETTVVDETGPEGDPGEQGNDGWSPILATAFDGERRVMQVTGWTGGTGSPPATGKYVGVTGLVDDIADAVDVRGRQGLQGPAGEPGEPGAVIIGEGVEMLTGEGPPDDSIGADKQLYLDELTGDVYKKENGTWGEPIANLKGPAGPRGLDGYQGSDGPPGATGPSGWSPLFAVVTSGARRVYQLVDWVGGGGTKPATGKYIGATGLVMNIADAVDVRGPQGLQGNDGAQGLRGPEGAQGIKGDPGSNGWLPVFAAAADGERRVFKVVDWQGGTGVKPAINVYLSSTGLTAVLADALDVRGAVGAQGPKGDDGEDGAPGAAGADGATFDPAGEWNNATNYSAHSLVSENGSSYTNNAASTNQRPSTTPSVWTLVAERGLQGVQGAPGTNGSDGTDGTDGIDGASGDKGWSPIFSVVNDGSRRVLRVVGWTGGQGEEPTAGQYVGALGLTNTIADAVDIRGPQGLQGVKGDQGIQGEPGTPGPDPINAADITVNIFGKMNANQKVLKQIVVRSFTLPSGLTHSNFSADASATSTYVLTFYKNGVSVGTLSWSAGATVPTVTFTSDVTFAEDDIFTITGQATADASLADISLNIYGTR